MGTGTPGPRGLPTPSIVPWTSPPKPGSGTHGPRAAHHPLTGHGVPPSSATSSLGHPQPPQLLCDHPSGPHAATGTRCQPCATHGRARAECGPTAERP